MKVSVQRVAVGELAVNCYIVENTLTHECFIVDPGAEKERIIRSVGERKVSAVLLTHGHYDHIGAVDDICAHYACPVYIHSADADKLSDAMANVSAVFAEPVTQHTVPVTVEEGSLTLAGMQVEIMHTPGHSNGSICCILPENQGVLTGDTLFAHGYGRTDFADGEFALLHHSLRKLFKLTPRMIAYPGHNGIGVVGRDPVEEQ